MKQSWTRWQFMVVPLGKRNGSFAGGSGWLRHLFLSDFKIDLAEFLEGAVGADLHGADGAIEQACDFLVVEVLEPREHEDLAVFVADAGEGAAHERDVVSGGGLGVGRRALI